MIDQNYIPPNISFFFFVVQDIHSIARLHVLFSNMLLVSSIFGIMWRLETIKAEKRPAGIRH